MQVELQGLLDVVVPPRKEMSVLVVGSDSGMRIAKLLREKGFDNVKVLTADEAMLDRTVVLGASGMQLPAELLISDFLVRTREIQPLLDVDRHHPPHGWYRQFERRGRGPLY